MSDIRKASDNNLASNQEEDFRKTPLFKQVKALIDQSKHHVKRAIDTTIVQTYWGIGQLVVEDEQNGNVRATYGEQTLQKLSDNLSDLYGSGFDITNLRKMRQFYLAFPIRDTVCLELSWSHYRFLLRVKNKDALQWYIKEASENNWSARALDRQISKLYYERLLASQDKTPVQNEAKARTDELKESSRNYLRDPYILDFLNLPKATGWVESKLESALISNLQEFLLELGKGFAFVERQQRVKTEDQDFYIDLVFYNFKLKCFLLIDLKMGKLTHQDVGQMDTYVRIYDQHKKDSSDNPTIGLILCSEKSEAVAKYSVLTDSKQLFASQYISYLPTEEELAKQLEEGRSLIDPEINGESES